MDDPTRPDPFAGLPPLMRECAAPDAVRYDLSAPWADRGHIYATDGRILARVPGGSVLPDVLLRIRGVERVPRNVPEMFDEHAPLRGVAFDLPEPTGPETVPCDQCKGVGRHGWDAAFGTPVPGDEDECSECDGTGRWPNWEPLEVAPGLWMSTRFIRLLRRHGAVVHRPHGTGPAYFAAGIVEGLVMPCRDPGEMEADRGGAVGKMSASSRP